MRGPWGRSAVLALGMSLAATTGRAADRSVAPTLKLHAIPGRAIPPAEVLLTAEFQDGIDVPDLRCPEIEWDFADGSRSVHQEGCERATAETKLDRRFTRRHAFDAPGEYQVVVTLRQGHRIVAQAAATIVVQGGTAPASSPQTASLP